jgi:RNA polymerase sigma factor (sigma-70 family)
MTDTRDDHDHHDHAQPGAAIPAPADERLAALVRDYGRLIRHVIRSVGGRDAATMAEDIEQAVLLGLWQQVAREQRIDHPASYVYRAAVRETVRALKRERARAERAEPLDEEVTPVAPIDDPYRKAERLQQREILARCIDELAPDRRRAVRAHLAGFAVAEIMELFDWPYQRARNLIARGMSDLRTSLLGRGIS